MRSATPKVMHKVAGEPMLGHVIRAARAAGADRMAVVVGPNAAAVEAFVGKAAPEAIGACAGASGSGRRMRCSRRRRRSRPRPTTCIVLYGDTPLITAETLKALRPDAREGRPRRARLHAGRPGRLRAAADRRQAAHRDPRGEGRDARGAGGPALQCRGHGVPRRRCCRCSGRSATRTPRANTTSPTWSSSPTRAKKTVTVLEADADEVAGVNDRAELAAAEALFQRGARAAAMADGATLIAPETVFFSYDTQARPRRDGRAQRLLRHRRDDRRRRHGQGLLPYRGRDDRDRARSSGRSRGSGRARRSARGRISATSSR